MHILNRNKYIIKIDLSALKEESRVLKRRDYTQFGKMLEKL